MWIRQKLEKHRCGCKMSTGWNERERQDQFLIMLKPHPQATTSRAVHPFAPSPGLSFSARKEVGGRPYSRLDPGFCALSLGRSPVALGNHKNPHDGSRRPRWSSASHSSRTALLLTTARLYLSTSTRPSSRLHSRLGPLLPASATRPSLQATLATCATPGNAHAQ